MPPKSEAETTPVESGGQVPTGGTSADPCPNAVRCRDLDAWHRAVSRARPEELELRRSDGKLTVSPVIVKAVALYLRAFMDGPSRPEPGANARPGRSTIADELGVSERQVDYALRALTGAGYLAQTAPGHTGSTPTFASALPYGHPESARRDAHTPLELEQEDASGRAQSPESARRDARERASGRAPTSALPPKPSPLPPSHVQAPLVQAHEGGRDGGGPRSDLTPVADRELAQELAERLDLTVEPRGRRREELEARLEELLEAGWTIAELARLPEVADHAPPDRNVAGALVYRLASVTGDPPAVVRERRERRAACSTCHGRGQVEVDDGSYHGSTVTCPACAELRQEAAS